MGREGHRKDIMRLSVDFVLREELFQKELWSVEANGVTGKLDGLFQNATSVKEQEGDGTGNLVLVKRVGKTELRLDTMQLNVRGVKKGLRRRDRWYIRECVLFDCMYKKKIKKSG